MNEFKIGNYDHDDGLCDWTTYEKWYCNCQNTVFGCKGRKVLSPMLLWDDLCEMYANNYCVRCTMRVIHEAA